MSSPSKETEKMDVDMDLSSNQTEETKKSTSKTDIAGQQSSVMAAPAVAPSITISLHPLVILNISEHWTRIRAQAGAKNQVYGALIGKQKGRNIEVMNSFELKIDYVDGEVIINRDYYNTKEQQYKQVFSELDFIGWYTTGESPTEKEIKIHKQICEINECPIMLQLNPLSKSVNQLPVKLFESVIDIVQGEATMLFIPLDYTLATEEAERIGVDHVVRMSTNDAGENSAVAEHLMAQHSAVKMLHIRVKMVLSYIRAIETGKCQPNQEILRDVYSLSQRLPVVQNPKFRGEFYTQTNDVGLITYLGALTKGCNDINHLVGKFNVLYDRKGVGRKMRGLFF